MKIIIIFTISIVVLFFFLSRMEADKGENDYIHARELMVKTQIEARGITDERLLNAMRKVKRHLFVPPLYWFFAYSDRPLPIGEGQTISQPYIVALMTELLELKGNEKVLEIGTGSGYQAAILAELAEKVYTIEILEPLAKRSKKLLEELGYDNIKVKCGDGYLGWPEYAPYDAIIVTCAPDDIPPPLIEQLAEGGRLVIPVGEEWQELKLVKKTDGKIVTTNIIPVRFVPMLRDEETVKKSIQEDSEMIQNLERHVKFLSKDIGERNFIQYQNLERAANYIIQEFKNYGYAPTEQIYYMEGKPFRNIIAEKSGGVKSSEVIIVCAHYDSVMGSPGADDNGSGVAGLLELSRLLSKENINKSIRFVAFTNEEPPFFMTEDMGSFRYAKEAKKNKSRTFQRGLIPRWKMRDKDNILGVLCLESIGYYSSEKKSQSYPFGFGFFYPDKGNFIAVVSNFQSRRLLKNVMNEFKKKMDFPIESHVGFSFLAPGISFSDQWSFWKFGYKAIMITDTAFYRNPYYHTSADTSETINYQSLQEVIKGVYWALLELCK